ncbi:hypothetical protein [Maribacter ulvicola]|uniref:Uncharacterized protein n=1 Tax=Maribacter ulvicola TaxID=228959 RepID=A0A1N6ZRJ4_9FLAO|nr:hypothetical protein [Maribacter ulvicola]SIR29512.1 hypothetical protein SAMN05421797_10994 [Maribacter ulvicola]
MKFKITTIVAIGILITSCKGEQSANKEALKTPVVTNKGQELVSKMLDKVGDYNTLRTKKDVLYTYTYQTADGKTDISTEKYIFDGELSYGKYELHERTLSDLEGTIEQGYDGKEFWLKQNGEILNDSIALKKVAFNRPTNFYWFTMFQKLMDKGVTYKYLGEETLNDIAYEVVKISFNFGESKPTDIYQLYINKNTSLVDQFLFTVADFAVVETPYLMTLKYEEVDGMLLPTKRKYKKSTWKAAVNDAPWTTVNWSNIKFNNALNKREFKK